MLVYRIPGSDLDEPFVGCNVRIDENFGIGKALASDPYLIADVVSELDRCW
jgi:hypothetical protein